MSRADRELAYEKALGAQVSDRVTAASWLTSSAELAALAPSFRTGGGAEARRAMGEGGEARDRARRAHRGELGYRSSEGSCLVLGSQLLHVPRVKVGILNGDERGVLNGDSDGNLG